MALLSSLNPFLRASLAASSTVFFLGMVAVGSQGKRLQVLNGRLKSRFATGESNGV